MAACVSAFQRHVRTSTVHVYSTATALLCIPVSISSLLPVLFLQYYPYNYYQRMFVYTHTVKTLAAAHARIYSSSHAHVNVLHPQSGDLIDMEAVKKAASGAVDTIRNSPLFRRKFGTQSRGELENEEPRPLSPERDTTPFVQGINFQVRDTPRVYTCVAQCSLPHYLFRPVCVARCPTWAVERCRAPWPRTME